MILRQATIKYKGYDPKDLSKGSHKKICCSCDECGKIRWLPKQGYRDLCLKCSRSSGENNGMHGIHRCGKDAPMFGKHHTKESKRKISESHKGLKHTN